MVAEDDLIWPAEELERLRSLERSASGELSANIVRPTPAPFPWAEALFTVGVTGTNGKSSCTHLIAAMLRAAEHSVLLQSTLGYWLNDSPLEVPRTLQGYLTALRHAARRGARHAAVEVTSAALARGFARMWRYDLGVFTNLSRDHLNDHGSWEHYLASKAQLFLHLAPGSTAVFNACDPASQLLDRVTPPDVTRRHYAVDTRGARHTKPDLAAARVRVSSTGTRIELEPSALAEELGGVLETELIGAIFAENTLAAALAATSVGVSAEAIRRGAASCSVSGRFELVLREPLVAVDYAHTPDALARTCDTARAVAGGARVIVVFGAGGEKDTVKREPMGRAVGERADIAIVTTDNARSEDPASIARAVAAGCSQGGRAEVKVELDRQRAIELALELAKRDDVVVIAGKGHERHQEVDGQKQPFSDVEHVLRAAGRS